MFITSADNNSSILDQKETKIYLQTKQIMDGLVSFVAGTKHRSQVTRARLVTVLLINTSNSDVQFLLKLKLYFRL